MTIARIPTIWSKPGTALKVLQVPCIRICLDWTTLNVPRLTQPLTTHRIPWNMRSRWGGLIISRPCHNHTIIQCIAAQDRPDIVLHCCHARLPLELATGAITQGIRYMERWVYTHHKIPAHKQQVRNKLRYDRQANDVPLLLVKRVLLRNRCWRDQGKLAPHWQPITSTKYNELSEIDLWGPVARTICAHALSHPLKLLEQNRWQSYNRKSGRPFSIVTLIPPVAREMALGQFRSKLEP